MSRPLRIQYPNAWYHVMNRGGRGRAIFESGDDFERFIDILKETIELFSLRVSAYCLMTDHYHLLVQTPDGNLSRCMRHINGVYTQRYNVEHGLDGPLFRGRYKSILVGEDSYLLQLVRYVHKNPLRAGMVKSCELYEMNLKRLPVILGEIPFVNTIRERFFERKRHIEVPESKLLAPDSAESQNN